MLIDIIMASKVKYKYVYRSLCIFSDQYCVCVFILTNEEAWFLEILTFQLRSFEPWFEAMYVNIPTYETIHKSDTHPTVH